MNAAPQKPSSMIIPCLRYRDAPAAIEWLEKVFAFQPQLIVPGPNSTIAHAQLTLGGGMIMLGSVRDEGTTFDRLIQQPDDIDGCETQCAYIVVDDPDAVYANAQNAGAEIMSAIKDEAYGGRGFACRDLENHLWFVGSYNPW